MEHVKINDEKRGQKGPVFLYINQKEYFVNRSSCGGNRKIETKMGGSGQLH
jgi:hypothetical protein